MSLTARQAHIRDMYRHDLSKRTTLIWSVLLMIHYTAETKSILEPLRALVTVTDFDAVLADLETEGLINLTTGRLEAQAFTYLAELFTQDAGPHDELPFNKFEVFTVHHTTPKTKKAALANWVTEAESLIREMVKHVSDLTIVPTKRGDGSVMLRLISDAADVPDLIFHIMATQRCNDVRDFVYLQHELKNTLQAQNDTPRTNAGVIGIAAAPSFANGALGGDVPTFLIGPINLSVLRHWFSEYANQANDIYKALLMCMMPDNGKFHGVLPMHRLYESIADICGLKPNHR
jgi:hypothetical protein